MTPILGIIASSMKGAPGIPTIGTATNAGSGRAYNNGSATVTFTAGPGAAATSFTATSNVGGYTATGASSPLTVTGLQSSSSYTFTVTATNASGTSAASFATNSITATTVPQAPTIGTATAGDASATVTYTAGATGGAAVSTFTATSSPGGLTGTGASPITVSGLTNGTGYTFTVTATNANGTSSASSASNSVSPVKVYAIGDTGPGGGKVFYDAGSVLSWGRYLEAATSSTSPAWTDAQKLFSGQNNAPINTTSTAIGTGLANTNAIVAQNNTANRSATVCKAYSGGSKTDWFSPSKDELNQLYIRKTTVGGTVDAFYWSSSEYPPDATGQAWSMNLTNGYQGENSKGQSYYVRAIRAH